ncbi:MAG: BatD family protein [Sphingobacteriaceae bacterium]
MKLKYAILLFLICSSRPLFADDVKFTASANSTSVGTGEQFEVTFTVNSDAERFMPPNLKDFMVLSGPNQSSSMSWINGVSSASISYSYDLMAVRTGEYIIGPAYINVEGHRIASNALKIKVVQGGGVSQNRRVSPQQDAQPITGRTNDIFRQLMIRAVVDQSSAYIGEQITLSYRLYTQVSLIGNNLDKLPDLNGFWSQEIKNPSQQVSWKTEIYNGEKYNVADLKQTILFPERSGDLVIDPLSMTFTVRQSEQATNLIEQFFGAFEDVNYKIKSLPITIHVKPLPIIGKPANFSGAVGAFHIDASLDKNELKANEALNYKFKISGSGNLMLLNAPKMEFPPDFEKYDPTLTDSISENLNGVSGYREYAYLIIPRQEGNFTIPAPKFSYFDPSTGKYVDLTDKAFPVKVNKGIPQGNDATLLPDEQQDIKNVDNDIRYIKTDLPDFIRANDPFFSSVLYFMLLATGPFVWILALALGKWKARYKQDEMKLKSRKANKMAAKHLSDARRHLQSGDATAFYEAVFKGLYGYLSDKLNIPISGLNKASIAAQLQSKLLDEQAVAQLLETLDICEMARFSPISDGATKAVYEKAKNIINDIGTRL